MPVFNGERFISAALDAILAQDFADFELIICDNASTDRTAEICAAYAHRDARIRYYRNDRNLGAAPNFNRCLDLARAPFFKWAAHDDLLAPGYLRRCLEPLERDPDAVLCHSLVAVVDSEGQSIGSYDSALRGADSPRVADRFAALILKRHLCTDMFGVIRTEALRRTGRHGAYYGGDRAMLAELALLGRFLKVDAPLFLNREHPGRFVRAVSASDWQRWHAGARPGEMINPTWRLYRDYRAAVMRHVDERADRERCLKVLRHWWWRDWNLARLATDAIGSVWPTVHGLVRRVKLRLYGALPQVTRHDDRGRPVKLVYIGGWGRSGSSLLANILGSARDIVSVGELRYLWDRGMRENKRCGCGEAFRECDFWGAVLQRAGIESSPRLGAHMRDAVGSRAARAQLAAMLTGRARAYRKRRSAELETLDRLYTAVAAQTGSVGVVDASKTPPYALNLLTNPNVELYFVHLVRDPRAVAHSWSRRRPTGESDDEMMPRYSGLKSGVYWILFNLLGLAFRLWPRAHYLRVRYEDLCEHPRPTVERILDHCGMPDSGLEWHGGGAVSVEPQHSISGNRSRFVTGRVDIRPDLAWHERMEPRARRVVTWTCAPVLALFGYRMNPAAPAAADRPAPETASRR